MCCTWSFHFIFEHGLIYSNGKYGIQYPKINSECYDNTVSNFVIHTTQQNNASCNSGGGMFINMYMPIQLHSQETGWYTSLHHSQKHTKEMTTLRSPSLTVDNYPVFHDKKCSTWFNPLFLWIVVIPHSAKRDRYAQNQVQWCVKSIPCGCRPKRFS